MRRVLQGLCVVVILAAPIAGQGAPPRSLTEQGRLIDKTSGMPVAGMASMTFTIYPAPIGGAVLWREVVDVMLDNGYFSVQLGASVPFPADLWQETPRYLGVKVGDDDELLPRDEITSVPFAFVAQDATGDIHPSSVSIGRTPVIDSKGNWVGPPTGLQGPKGDQGDKGEKGDRGDNGKSVGWSETLYDVVLQTTSLPNRGVAQEGGKIASFTFNTAAAGAALVMLDVGVRVRNAYDSPPTEQYDCRVVSALSLSGLPPPDIRGSLAEPGIAFNWIPASLPTIANGGTYLQVSQSTSRIISVAPGDNKIYVTAATDCLVAMWSPITVSVVLLGSGEKLKGCSANQPGCQ
jgi:hypothetical protein